jgi:arsenate reductase (thioredoxin)
VFKSGKFFGYVVTVCDEASAERCPIFAGVTKRLHWSFPDPSTLTGTNEKKMAKVREIRDMIKAKVEQWCEEFCEKEPVPIETGPPTT